MLVTHEWLKEHLDDSDIVILDTRPKIAYTYDHIPHSQSLEVDKVKLYDGSFMDWYGRRLPLE